MDGSENGSKNGSWEQKRVRSWLLTRRGPTIPEAPNAIDAVTAGREQAVAADTKRTEGAETVGFPDPVRRRE